MEPKVVVIVIDDSAFTARHNVFEVEVSMAEVHEVVFELPGPVAPSPVFDARANHPAGPRVVIVVEVEIIAAAEGPRTVVPQPHAEASIGKRAAALDIEQPVAGLAKRHAEARSYARDPVTAVAAPEHAIVHCAPGEEAASVVAIIMSDGGYLALDTPHVLADLVIEADLAAADEVAVIAPVPIVAVEANDPRELPRKTTVAIEPVVAISVAPSPADVAANVEAGPVVHDWRCYRWRLYGHVRCLRGTPQHHGGEGTQSKQKQLSHESPLSDLVQPTLAGLWVATYREEGQRTVTDEQLQRSII
jgi:hypothetical protein